MSSTIPASMVKELRDKTGAGMMECKKALQKSEGDFDAAVKHLRESGIAKAAKREGRTAAEGLVQMAVSEDGTAGALAELNCETDFVARNEEFSALVEEAANVALAAAVEDAEQLLATKLPSTGKSVAEGVEGLLAKIGEKITLSRAATLKADLVTGYIHPPGKIGVLVGAKLDGAQKTPELEEALKDIAMHVAAFAPRFLSDADVDQETLEAEKEIFANIARNEGKPENIIPRIVEGKIKSFYKESCLLYQPFAKDPGQTVQEVVNEAAKTSGGKVELTGFVRFRLGETAAPGAK